jgi:hypothetical protein
VRFTGLAGGDRLQDTDFSSAGTLNIQDRRCRQAIISCCPSSCGVTGFESTVRTGAAGGNDACQWPAAAAQPCTPLGEQSQARGRVQQSRAFKKRLQHTLHTKSATFCLCGTAVGICTQQGRGQSASMHWQGKGAVSSTAPKGNQDTCAGMCTFTFSSACMPNHFLGAC